jgi:hypothetical protein
MLLVAPGFAEPERSEPLTTEKAFQIADELFVSSLGCGAVSNAPRDLGDVWAFDVRIGPGATPDPHPILVNKATGRASWVTGDEVIQERREAEANRNWYQGLPASEPW